MRDQRAGMKDRRVTGHAPSLITHPLSFIRDLLAGAKRPAEAVRPPVGLDRPLLRNEEYVLAARPFLHGLTPERIVAVFDNADTAIADQIELAAEFEASNDHLAGTLELRRTAVLRLQVSVVAGDYEDERSVAAAELADRFVQAGWFKLACDWLLRAIWHQHAAAELLYGQTDGKWMPTGFRAVEPARWYFDRTKEPHLYASLTQNPTDLVELTPGRFAVLGYGAIYGQPGKYAVVQDTAKLAFLRGFALTDWGVRTDKHGQPFLHVQYEAGMQTPQIQQVVNTLLAYAGQMIAATPAGTNLEMLEVNPDSPHQKLVEFCDRAISKRLLGQDTAQSALEGQRTGSQIQAQVRDDIRDKDAELLDAALNETLLAPWCSWNFGPDVAPPLIRHAAKENRDPVQTGAVIKIAREIGLPVAKAFAYRALAIDEPGEDEELLQDSSQLSALSPQPGEETGASGPVSGTAGPAPAAPLNAGSISAAIDILSKLREMVLEPEPATVLLTALGLAEDKAAAMVKATPRGKKDSDSDVAFKREVVKAFLIDGTVNDVLYNRTAIGELLSAVNIPLDPDYVEPWLPVTTASGAEVTGEVIKDAEGDIVGGTTGNATTEAQRPQSGEEGKEPVEGGDGAGQEPTEAQPQRPQSEEAGKEPTEEQPQRPQSEKENKAPAEDVTAARRTLVAASQSLNPSIPQSLFAGVTNAVRTLADDCSSLTEFRARLTELLGAGGADVEDALHTATFGAYCAGRLQTDEELNRRERRGRRERTISSNLCGLCDLGGLSVLASGGGVERGRFTEAIDHFAQRTDLLPKEEFLKLQGLNRARAWTVARVADLGVMKDLHGAVGQAIEGGQSWREFKDSLDSIMEQRGWAGLEPWHARTVYEQNVLMANSAGRYMQSEDAGAGYYRYLPSDSQTPRPEHMPYYHQVYVLGSGPMPPLDFGCKCNWEPVFDEELSEADRARLGQVESGALPAPTETDPEYQFRPGDYFRPLSLRKGDYPEEFWGVIQSLASSANALLALRG